MKKLIFSIFAIVALMLSSCADKNAERILKTVPSNTQVLALIKADELSSALGEEGRNEVKQLINSASRGNNSGKEMANYIMSDDSQLDLSVPMAMFEYKNAVIYTCITKNSDKLREDLERITNSKFTKNLGVWALEDNTIFIAGDQAWFTSSYPEVTTQYVNGFTKLNKAASMADNEYVMKMAADGGEISFLMDLTSILKYNMSTTTSLAMSMIFENPKYLTGNINFEKGKIKGDVGILNNKFDPAALSIKLTNIDMNQLKAFKGKGNVFAATSIDSSVLNQLIGQFKGMLPLPQQTLSLLEELDGTIVASANLSSSSSAPNSSAVMLNFKSADAAARCKDVLVSILNGAGGLEISNEGTALYIMTPMQDGADISQVANDFNGANVGFVTMIDKMPPVDNINLGNYFNTCVVKMTARGNSTTLNFTMNTKPGQNSLLTLFQFINASQKY